MTAPRLLLVVLAVLAAVVLVATATVIVDARRPTPVTATVAADPAASRTEAISVLADWDRRRAAAWSAGDPAALEALYLSGSRAGRADVAMLDRWRDRGLRVSGLRMQVRDVAVRSAAESRWELVVTDRVVGAQAVGRRTPAALPRDGWSTRRITLVRVAGDWRVAAVRTEPARP